MTDQNQAPQENLTAWKRGWLWVFVVSVIGFLISLGMVEYYEGFWAAFAATPYPYLAITFVVSGVNFFHLTVTRRHPPWWW